MSGSADISGAAEATRAAPVRAAVRQALAQVMPPGRHLEPDPPWLLTRQVLAAIGGAGGFRACLDPGSGRLSLAALGALVGELAVRAPAGVTLSACLQTGLFCGLLADLAGGDQRGVLDAVVAGEAVGAVAVTDADLAGSDVAGMATALASDPQRRTLTGAKDWITSACLADYVIVCARRRPGRHLTSFDLLLLPTAAPGVRAVPRDTAVMRHAGIGRLEFAGVPVGPESLLGRPGLGLANFLRHVANERLAGGFWAAALGRELLARTAARLARRRAGAATLWHESAVRQRLARAAVQIRLLEALTAEIVRQAPIAPAPAADSAVLKAALTPMLTEAVATCVQLHGADGFTQAAGLVELLGDLRAFGVAGGSEETALEVVAGSELVRGPASVPEPQPAVAGAGGGVADGG